MPRPPQQLSSPPSMRRRKPRWRPGSLARMRTRRKRNKRPIALTRDPTIGPRLVQNPRDHIQEVIMKRTVMVLLAGIALIMPVVVQAQVAGSTLLGVSYGDLREVTLGWGPRRQTPGLPAYTKL